MKLLLIGNHTCGNRGDCAILRGLLERLAILLPDAEITVTSRYPVSSSYLLGHPMIMDPLYAWHMRSSGGLIGKIKARCATYVIPALMMLAIRTGRRWPLRLLPREFRHEISALHKFDAVIQVGGSFFVDLYGCGQFEYPFAALLAKKPLLLFGQSMGPFAGKLYGRLAATLLEYSHEVVLREQVSKDMIDRSALPARRVTKGGDTAWLVAPLDGRGSSIEWLEQRAGQRPVVAITVRELAPFDKRLNTTQSAYESALAQLVDRLIDAGFDVIAAATCTAIDNYHRDDRMNALRVGAQVKAQDHYHVIVDESNDVQLGQLFRRCALVIGTRLHSAIIAMNFGTPAITINYEHKSEGIMRQLGLEHLSQPLTALLDGSLADIALNVLGRVDTTKEQVRVAVERERLHTMDKLADSLRSLGVSGARL